MNALPVLATTAVLLAAIAADSLVLALLAPLPLLLRLVLLSGELCEAQASLVKLLGDRRKVGDPVLDRESLPQLLEALRYRLRMGTTVTGTVRSSLLPARYSESEFTGRDSTESSPLRMKLAALPSTYAVLVRLAVEDSSAPLLLEGRTPADPRFEPRLRARLMGYLLNGTDIGFGARDELLHDVVVGSLAELGIEYSVAYAVRGPQGRREILWCGYHGARRPREGEVLEIYEFAKELAQNAETRERLDVLAARASEAEQGSREKSEFLAQLSHDMRSPLNNIRVILTLMREEYRQETSEELVEMASANCAALNDLIEDVLDLTRHGVGKLSARPRRFNLSDLVRQIGAQFGPAVRAKGLEIHVDLNEAEACFLDADFGHVRRILSNLVSNAIKYTRYGRIDIELERRSEKQLALVVQDTGCGMSPRELEKLFVPFTRFARAGADGAGLGLAVSKILVELNGGSISVTSKEGEGSRFEVLLPAASIASGVPEEAIARAAPAATQCDLSGLRVLVVDDDADCVHTLSRLLEQHRAHVFRSCSVSEAVGLLNFELPDCVVSDGAMPDGGAAKILDVLRAWDAPIDVLVLSGDAGNERKEAYRALGAKAVYEKPVLSSDILSWCKEVLTRKEATLVRHAYS